MFQDGSDSNSTSGSDKVQRGVRQVAAERGGGGEGVLSGVGRLVLVWSPGERLGIAGDCYVGGKQVVGGSSDGMVVVINHPEDILHAFDGGGAREIGDNGDFGLKRADTVGVDLVAEELDR